MFSVQDVFNLNFRSRGPVWCKLAFPSDQQMEERTKRQKLIRKDLGRGNTDTTFTPILDYDMELYRDLVKEESREFEKHEASKAIKMLLDSQKLSDPIFLGDSQVQVELIVCGDVETRHILNEPSLADADGFESRAVKTNYGNGMTETRFSILPAIELYDRLLVKAEGYTEGTRIPAAHKSEVISAMFKLVNGPSL